MYRDKYNGQVDIYDFIQPFGGHLKEDNRWVILRKMIDWEMIDKEYREHFDNKLSGQEAYSSDVAFGSLYIQRRQGLTDRDLVEEIAENPYMQYFIGYKEYRNEKPFDPSLLVTFRKRLPKEVMNRIIENMFLEAANPDNSCDAENDKKCDGENKDNKGSDENKDKKDSDNNNDNNNSGSNDGNDGSNCNRDSGKDEPSHGGSNGNDGSNCIGDSGKNEASQGSNNENVGSNCIGDSGKGEASQGSNNGNGGSNCIGDSGKGEASQDSNNGNGGSNCSGDSGKNEASQGNKPAKPDKVPNKGTLIIDATCTPADIAYPTDLELCDKARRWTEVILDHYWSLYGSVDGKKEKPRTYREVARLRFLKLNKRRRKSAKKIRKELRYQLGCIRRNLDYIEGYALKYGFEGLFRIEKERLLTIVTFYEQQKVMLDTKTHSVEDRIVSLSQPWIRPIVRGKSKAPTEFGAKISVSVVNGYTFMDRLSFDAYNEGEANEFINVIEAYRRRFGCYPLRVLADKIYRSRNNRTFCKEHGIRISGPRLGRRGKNHPEELRQELKEIGERKEVEGKFGNGKRKLGLSRIMAKLKETTGCMVGMDIFILNMERLLRKKVLFLYSFFCTALCTS